MSRKVKCVDVYQCDWCPQTFEDEDTHAFILYFWRGEGKEGPLHFCSNKCFLGWVDRVIRKETT